MTMDRRYFMFACDPGNNAHMLHRTLPVRLGFDLGDIDIGKAVTRMLTPSDQQIKALKELAPMAAAFTGAATGTTALTQVGAAFGGVSLPGSQQTVPMGGGMYAVPYQQSSGLFGLSPMTLLAIALGALGIVFVATAK